MLQLPGVTKIKASRRIIALAIQDVYDAWEQGEGERHSGYLSYDVAHRVRNVLEKEGFNAAVSEKDGQIFVVARTSEGIYRVNIPNHIYETSAGHLWKKTAGVTFTPDDILVDQLDNNPNRWEQYSDIPLMEEELWISPKDLYDKAVQVTPESDPIWLKADTWAPELMDPNPEFEGVAPLTQPGWLEATGVEGESPNIVMVNDVPPPPAEPTFSGGPEWVSPQAMAATAKDTSTYTMVDSVPDPPVSTRPPEGTVVTARPTTWSTPMAVNAPPPTVTAVRTTPVSVPVKRGVPSAPPAPVAVDIMRAGPVTVLKGGY